MKRSKLVIIVASVLIFLDAIFALSGYQVSDIRKAGVDISYTLLFLGILYFLEKEDDNNKQPPK